MEGRSDYTQGCITGGAEDGGQRRAEDCSQDDIKGSAESRAQGDDDQRKEVRVTGEARHERTKQSGRGSIQLSRH